MNETNGVERDESGELNELASALAKAQGKIRTAEMDRTNPHFKSKYSTLAAVWDACREPLTSNGLSVLQRVSSTAEGVIVTTQLLHSSGQWLKDRLFLPVAQRTPQGFGSAISYAKRYALAALVGVASADEDDDGNAASAGSRAEEVRVSLRAPSQASAHQAEEPVKDTSVSDGTPVVPYGKLRGTPLSTLKAQQLDWYAQKAREELADASKAKFHAKTQAFLAQLEAAREALGGGEP